MPFAFLESVKNEFRDKYGEKARTAQAGSLDRAFGWALTISSTTGWISVSVKHPCVLLRSPSVSRGTRTYHCVQDVKLLYAEQAQAEVPHGLLHGAPRGAVPGGRPAEEG